MRTDTMPEAASPPAASAQGVSTRHYGMDWLRIGAFGLLILYHIGMYFVPWGWHVKTPQPIEWAMLPMMASNAWRIPLLFVVSGFASAALFARLPAPGRFLGNRTIRLMVPTLFAMAVIIPPQPWVELSFKHGYTASFWHFWFADYFRFGTIDGIVVPTWQHLWFVVYLWAYTLLLGLALWAIPAKARARLGAVADRGLAGPLIIVTPLALLWARLALSWPGAEETHAFFDDGLAHSVYFPLFVFGFYLQGSASSWAAIRRWWKVAAVLSVSGFALVVALIFAYRAGFAQTLATDIAWGMARDVQGWCAILALIGLADRFGNRDHRLRPMLTEAVFPFYIIHQTVIVVVGWWLLKTALGPGTAFLVLLAATVAGCWLFYRIGRMVTLLRPLIGLKYRGGAVQRGRDMHMLNSSLT